MADDPAQPEPRPNIKELLDSVDVEPVREAPDEDDPYSQLEKRDLDYEKKLAELEEYKAHAQQRRQFADRIFVLTCSWVVGIFILMFLDGSDYKGFHLSDAVMLGAIVTTTANILGVLIIVAKYFFPSHSPDETKNPPSSA